jgi:protein O-mannosyl-transferase
MVSPMRQRTARRHGNPRTRNWNSVAEPVLNGHWLLGLAFVLAAVSYCPTLRYGFVFDDVPQIVENPAIRSWASVPQYFTAHVGTGVFPGAGGSFYRPVFLIWLRLNYMLFEVSPWGWHLTSLLAHLGAIWVFFLLVRQWTTDSMVAGWAALLFAVHPIHIEAVAWISAVPEILFAMAGMGAIFAYLRFRQEQRRSLLGISVFLYGLALLAKETAIVIWPVIFISEYWLDRVSPSERHTNDRFANAKVQSLFAAATAAYFGLRLLALHGISGEVTHTIREAACSVPSITWFYLQKLALPIRLSEIYVDPEAWSFASPHFYIPLIAVSTVAVGLLLWASKSKSAVLPASLLGLPLIPPLLGVLVFPRHDLAHDRYLYLPSAGACMLLALVLRAAVRAARPSTNMSSSRIGTSIVLVLSLGLVLSVWAQERPYRDNVTLFTRSVQLFPESARAWGLLGEEYMTRGRYNEGFDAFHRALSLEPNALLNNYRLGAAYYLVGDTRTAEAYFQRAVETYHNPDVVTYDYLLYRLGLSQYAQGMMPQAEATLRRATDLQPRGFGYHVALGAALRYEGNLTEAKKQLQLELQLGPDQQASALLKAVDTESSTRILH